jgi:mannosyltransferase OCH1-like enzyme
MKKLHQIYISDDNAPPSEYVSVQMQKLRHMYNDYKYVLYNDEMCRDQIHALLGKGAVKLYDSLNSYAFRADFARYCILHQHGGFYFDSAICPEFKLEFENFSVLYRSPRFAVDNHIAIDNGVMYFNRTQHPFLTDAIQQCVKNIKHQSYGVHLLDITGPVMLGRLKEYDIQFGYSKLVNPTQKAAFFKDTIHWMHKPEKIQLWELGCVGTNTYKEMWFDRKVFS